MFRLSIQKTRIIFTLFFLALAIPAAILSYKAHEQLRWQGMHQYQLEAQSLVEQIDNELQDAIEREGARSDVDYTFFVLAGTPEARLVQRSELARFPVDSDLPGVIGYFQVNDEGEFSSPILPSDHVQSAVHPQLYGISPEENYQRNQLQDLVASILAKNQLTVHKKEGHEAVKTDKESDVTSSSGVIAGFRTKDLKDGFSSGSSNLLEKYPSITEELIDTRQKKLEFSELAEREQVRKIKSLSQKTVDAKATSPNKQRASTANSNYLDQDQARLLGKLRDLTQQESKKVNRLSKQKRERNTRLEKNYSPQQSLVKAPNSSQRIASEKVQISLFESSIEPFKFSRLESGHFVMYRQVWQNGRRLFQGAVVSAQDFIEQAMTDNFKSSLLADITDLRISYLGEGIKTSKGKQHDTRSKLNQSLQGETLLSMNLSEPLNQFNLIFKVNSMPLGAGASFIKTLAFSLLTILVLGTYLLYRITLKQSSLVQQQQDFVSSVSHELKTPLTSIRMYGEILKQGWVEKEKREEYYDYIYNESERLSRLIANVLQISKVNHNALDLNIEAIEISEIVNLIRSKLDSQMKQSEFSLDIHVDDQLSKQTIAIDSDAFIQIIINLVDNALKYAKGAENKRIDLNFKSVNNKVEVSVRDYGPGIAKSQIKKIFDLFYRSGDELTRTTTGTGIGLALVKELSTAMHAEIEAINQTPGAKFSIVFSP